MGRKPWDLPNSPNGEAMKWAWPGIDFGEHIDDWVDITAVGDAIEKQWSPSTGLKRGRQYKGFWIELKEKEKVKDNG